MTEKTTKPTNSEPTQGFNGKGTWTRVSDLTRYDQNFDRINWSKAEQGTKNARKDTKP